MDNIDLNLEINAILNSECKKNQNDILCHEIDFNLADDTLKNIINYTDLNIKNEFDANEMFIKRAFINLTIDEDQLNPEGGGDGLPILKEFNKFILPSYLKLLTIPGIDNQTIIDLYKNTEICWEAVDKENKNHFNLKRFFKNMDNTFFDNPPLKSNLYDKYNQPEIYIYAYNYEKLEETCELWMDTSYKGHATSSIIKKTGVDTYEVNIINSNDGQYSENIIGPDDKRGHFGIKCRAIMTFEIKPNPIKNITSLPRVLKFIYFFSNFSSFMLNRTDSSEREEIDFVELGLDNTTFYQKIIPLILINKDGQLIKKDGTFADKTQDDDFRLKTYAKYTDAEAPWQILNVQTPGNCQFRAILYPLLWKLYDIDQTNQSTDMIKYDRFNEWYNKIKYYEIIRAFYIIYRYNLISLKYQNIFNELIISYEKLIKKNEIKLNVDIQKNIDIVIELKRKINLKFIRFLSGISYNSKESTENIDGNINKNIFQDEHRQYKKDTNLLLSNSNIFINPIKNSILFISKDNDIYNICRKFKEINEYCNNINNIIQEHLIANENLHKLGNYYILSIEDLIDICHKYIIEFNFIQPITKSDLIILTEYLSNIIEKYISIRISVPIFSHQFDQSPLYCMGVLQILGKLIECSVVKKNKTSVPELHKSLLLERIASAVPLHQKQKDFYDRLCTNIELSYDLLMLNDNDHSANPHFYKNG